MKRRDFITLLAGAAAWPLAAQAQQTTTPVIGYLASASEQGSRRFVAAFRNGLTESGYIEGRDVQVEYRWADNQYDRLPALAAELVRHPVSVIVASGGPAAPVAAKAATSIIPIVFTATSDPVRLGLVASLNRPGGNITGTGAFTIELDAKRLEMLRELVPKVGLIGALVNRNRPDAYAQSQQVERAAQAVGQQVHVVMAGNEREIDSVFAALVQQQIGALLVGADPFFSSQREQVVALAARHGLPAVYMSRDFVLAGGLASYGTIIADGYRQAAIYVAQILKGAKPADLPVMQPTKFELVINLKTAKALGLEIPPTLLARADEVIE